MNEHSYIASTMWHKYILFLSLLCFVLGTEFTLPGACPDVKIQENLDFIKFSGDWYNIGSYASDGRNINDCSILDFQEDNIGFILKETYVQMDQGTRIQKSYTARVDPMFDASNRGKFVVSYEDNDKVLQFPFYILSTDYENYAIAYTCKKNLKSHYVYAWILTRNKEKLDGVQKIIVESALSKYSELFEQKDSFVFKEFSDENCAFSEKYKTDFFTSNFW